MRIVLNKTVIIVLAIIIASVSIICWYFTSTEVVTKTSIISWKYIDSDTYTSGGYEGVPVTSTNIDRWMFLMENGDEVSVSSSCFANFNVGDEYTYEARVWK